MMGEVVGRGMRFENVSILTDNIMDVIKDMRYCWVDPNGMICDQRGIFRVNCIDCLDRTNIVQSAIARIVLEIQCRKLGLLAPEELLPDACRLTFQQMWANNGDIISQQYAGTPALKGDYTRTGERKFSGLMKDGMNSANRYYINRVKDVYRQAAIDIMLGLDLQTEELNALALSGGVRPEPAEETEVEREQNLRTLIEESRRMLLGETEECLGAWGLIDCDPATGDPTQQDTDIILLLSQHAYYVANYDDDIDQVKSYQKIQLKDLEKVEIGPAPSLFKSKYMCIRIYYTSTEGTSHFHAFRTTNTRLFNNIIVHIHNDEEARESLKAIAETFVAAKKLTSQDLPFIECKLDRKRTRPHSGVINITQQAQAQVTTLQRGATGLPGRAATSSSLSQQAGPLTSRLGRTFASFNPVRHIRLGRMKPNVSQFIPAVWYSKDDAPTDGSTEQARILKGDKIVSLPNVVVSPGVKQINLKREYDLDDIIDGEESDDLDDDPYGWPSKVDTSVDFHLLSCGIIRTSPVTSVTSLMRDRISKMFSDRGIVHMETTRWRNGDQRYRSDTLYDAHTAVKVPPICSATFTLDTDTDDKDDSNRPVQDHTEHQGPAPNSNADVQSSIPGNTRRQSRSSSIDSSASQNEWVTSSVVTLSSDNVDAVSPLSRLRSKMSSLTGGASLGARARPENRQQSRQLVNFALQNRINSELRFREIRTKIILL
ncbi:hypothetical protein NP493_526g00010 [Ridgeia piscesae]|uniref:Phosphatidylinositide phosphatase SAC2 n=1 Tax=Ridgeia piscesae TaxID=27915 RepID=A0AAD9NSF6_RIDPI|nr:hypothetical protein NP493_526g00010 [Ridgeia piscesae]